MLVRVIACSLLAAAALSSPSARAEDGQGDTKPPPLAPRAWRERYEEARTSIVDGRWQDAQPILRELSARAPDEPHRVLAVELERLAAAYAERDARARRPIRSSDELTLLYASSFLYGVGSGAWFLLQTQPDTALSATLPFAVITAAPVIAVATVDGHERLRRGVPHALSAGLYLGLGEGIWIVGYQHARSERMRETDRDTSVRWEPESVATVLWGASTLGATMGGLLGSSLVTTPGRVSFTASLTMWAGALTGFAVGALHPDDAYRRERAFLAGGVGYNAGLAGGLLAAGAVSPSVARVRLVDLCGLAGGGVPLGLYLAVARDSDARMSEGVFVLGAGAGLVAGWLLTSRMGKDVPRSGPASTVVVNPSVLPIAGGATFGLSGAM